VNVSDQELIQQLLSGEVTIAEKGWESVYTSFYPIISEMVRQNHGSEDDSIDIFQDALAILNHNLKTGKFRGDSSIKTYIFSICKNLWLKEFARKQKQSVAEAESVLVSQEDTDYLINVEVVSLLMNELQEDCRSILIEYYYNNRSMAELKEIFNVNSIQVAKTKKWRCLNYLKRLFIEKGLVPFSS
jgi:RNA polymerase sigma factor (sigma-70 family)